MFKDLTEIMNYACLYSEQIRFLVRFYKLNVYGHSLCSSEMYVLLQL